MRLLKSKAAGYNGKNAYDLKQLATSDLNYNYEMKVILIIITVSILKDCREN